ncbi:hemerythrin domain-containing protein [Hydrotalea sandarakina]|jgi:hemerythrin-like domain-containing protein|uniref:Hemerythrin-like domain-containing protein n=1 Tax=Hydrotalea sandarakina TaxID=1004304 RepID=A0A2W7RYR2_9BACT|nr:hemerythrin domain-containing protein [Hydrotalea sandarakina]PZX65913.1 hypothetical protein LX80_00407 [Hydrotalea sandarakina]
MPIKRSEAMQPLSRQHHNALLFCLLLKKGIAKKADNSVMKDFCISFWENDLMHHFQLEEDLLYSLGNTYPVLQSGLLQMKDEHTALQQYMNQIKIHVTYAILTEYVNLLEKHVRFEERILFPHIENTINSNILQQIGKALVQEEEHNCLQYPIHFWE